MKNSEACFRKRGLIQNMKLVWKLEQAYFGNVGKDVEALENRLIDFSSLERPNLRQTNKVEFYAYFIFSFESETY